MRRRREKARLPDGSLRISGAGQALRIMARPNARNSQDRGPSSQQSAPKIPNRSGFRQGGKGGGGYAVRITTDCIGVFPRPLASRKDYASDDPIPPDTPSF